MSRFETTHQVRRRWLLTGRLPHGRRIGYLFSTITGSPVCVAKAYRHTVHNVALGLDIGIEGHNAIQCSSWFDG